jgi:RNA polymerase sigma factor (TIGR02999 family)
MKHAKITALLGEWQAGDTGALSRVIPLVYEELRCAAASAAQRDWRNRTLCATALVHEAYLVLERSVPVRCVDRSHFKAIVKRLMHQILIQYSRRKGALKRGGPETALPLEADVVASGIASASLDVETALDGLRRRSPRTHLIIEMHYRGGYSAREIAEVLQTSLRTVERELTSGRGWIECQLSPNKL